MFEFLYGGIKIKTDKESYKLGETINATIILELKKPVKARALVVRFRAYRGRRKTGSYGPKLAGGLHLDERILEKEGVFSGINEYNVSFNIPNDPRFASIPGLFGFIGSASIHWEIVAKLDIPGGPDITARKQLSVTGV